MARQGHALDRILKLIDAALPPEQNDGASGPPPEFQSEAPAL